MSAAAFATSGTFAKALLESGWSPGAAVTARILLAAAVLTGPAIASLDGRWDLLRRNVGLIATFGLLAVAGCQLFYFNAVRTLSVGVALLLEYLGIVLVVVWLWLRHGRRPRRWTLVGSATALAGLVLVLDVTGGMRIDAAGVLWGLAAAVGLATYFVLSARDTTGLPPLAMAAGGMAIGGTALALAGIIGLLPMHAGTDDVVLAGAEVPWWVPGAGVSIVAGAFAYTVGIASSRLLGSKVASFVGLTEVLFAVAFAWLLLGDRPLPVQFVGGALIVAGVAAVRYDELRDDTIDRTTDVDTVPASG